MLSTAASANTPESLITSLSSGHISLAEVSDHLARTDLPAGFEDESFRRLKAHFSQYNMNFIGLKKAQRDAPNKQLTLQHILNAKPVKSNHQYPQKSDHKEQLVTAIEPTKAPMIDAPFCNSGKIVMRQGEDIIFCTAHLVAPGFLLTAAHCFGGDYDISQLVWYQGFDRGTFINEIKPLWIIHNRNYDKAIKQVEQSIRRPTDDESAMDAGLDYVLLGFPQRSTQSKGNPIECFKRGENNWKPRTGLQLGYGTDYGANNELYASKITIQGVIQDPADPLAETLSPRTTLYDGIPLGEGASGGPFLFPGLDGKTSVITGSLSGRLEYEGGTSFQFGPTFLAGSNFARFLHANKIPSIDCEL